VRRWSPRFTASSATPQDPRFSGCWLTNAAAVCDGFANFSNFPAASTLVGAVPELLPVSFGARGFFTSAVVAFVRCKKGERVMVLGMSLSTFTMLHVIISLIGIVSGLVVLFGLFGSRELPGLTALFLLTTILTSATGFLFPFDKLLPSHMIGILSLVLLAIACIALYGMKLAGAWRWIYVVTAMVALYLNVFVLVIQSFLKIGPLHALAPSVPPSEPPFAVVQGVILVFFIIAIIGAVRRFRPM
jgi:hypothetical protein